MKHTVRIHDKRHSHIAAAETSLFNADWSPIFTTHDVETAQTHLQTIMSQSLSKFPMRSVTLTNRNPQWKNSLIKDLEQRRSSAFRKNDEPLVNQLTQTLKNEISKAKKRHVEKLSRGSRSWWKDK